MKPIRRDFRVDDAVLGDFRAYVESRKLRFTDEDFTSNRDEIVRRLEEQVLMQVFGEGEARRRSAAWDPQIAKALALVPRAAMLIQDPRTYVAERERDRRLADAAASSPLPPARSADHSRGLTDLPREWSDFVAPPPREKPRVPFDGPEWIIRSEDHAAS